MTECEKCGRPLVEGEEGLCPSCRKPWSEVTKTASEVGDLASEKSRLTKLKLKSFLAKRSNKGE